MPLGRSCIPCQPPAIAGFYNRQTYRQTNRCTYSWQSVYWIDASWLELYIPSVTHPSRILYQRHKLIKPAHRSRILYQRHKDKQMYLQSQYTGRMPLGWSCISRQPPAVARFYIRDIQTDKQTYLQLTESVYWRDASWLELYTQLATRRSQIL